MILKMISSQIKNPLIKMIIDQNNLDSYTLSSETNFKKMSLAEKEWEIIKLLNRVEGSDGTNFMFGKHTQIQSIDEGYDQPLCSVFSHIAHHKVDMDIIDYMVDNSEHIRTNTTLHTPLEFYLLCYSVMVKEDVMYLPYDLLKKMIYKTDIKSIETVVIEEDSVGLLTLMVNYMTNGGLIEPAELNYFLSNVDLSYAKKYRFFAEESLYSKVLSVIESYELSISVDKVLLSNKSHKL